MVPILDMIIHTWDLAKATGQNTSWIADYASLTMWSGPSRETSKTLWHIELRPILLEEIFVNLDYSCNKMTIGLFASVK